MQNADPSLLSRCVINGKLERPDFGLELLSHIFDHFSLHPHRVSVIVGCHNIEDKKEVKYIKEMLFRAYRVPSVSVFPSAFLSLCHARRDSGLVLSLGHDVISLSLFAPGARLIKSKAFYLSLRVQQSPISILGYGQRQETVKGSVHSSLSPSFVSAFPFSSLFCVLMSMPGHGYYYKHRKCTYVILVVTQDVERKEYPDADEIISELLLPLLAEPEVVEYICSEQTEADVFLVTGGWSHALFEMNSCTKREERTSEGEAKGESEEVQRSERHFLIDVLGKVLDLAYFSLFEESLRAVEHELLSRFSISVSMEPINDVALGGAIMVRYRCQAL